MEYSCYKDAFDALIQDNDGVLPDLYEVFNIIIHGHSSNSEAGITVAEVVAYALVEVSTAKAAAPCPSPSATELPYLSIPAGQPLQLDTLLNHAVASLN
ncbi:MAG: hypothetical protein EOO55_01165 [Hymenobacter sp.]|nr:MAG: hypothetical protein EOO55_01165 [Hymenobacter sp.]